MMEKVLFTGITPEQLQNEITKGIKSHLDEFLKNFTYFIKKSFSC